MPRVPPHDREQESRFSPRALVWAVIPLLLLALVLAVIVRTKKERRRAETEAVVTAS